GHFVRVEARVFSHLQASQHFHCFRIYRETLSRFSCRRVTGNPHAQSSSKQPTIPSLVSRFPVCGRATAATDQPDLGRMSIC
ncbi:hypothetical protein ABLN72_04535, partial [Mycobacterium tuberculosis]